VSNYELPLPKTAPTDLESYFAFMSDNFSAATARSACENFGNPF